MGFYDSVKDSVRSEAQQSQQAENADSEDGDEDGEGMMAFEQLKKDAERARDEEDGVDETPASTDRSEDRSDTTDTATRTHTGTDTDIEVLTTDEDMGSQQPSRQSGVQQQTEQTTDIGDDRKSIGVPGDTSRDTATSAPETVQEASGTTGQDAASTSPSRDTQRTQESSSPTPSDQGQAQEHPVRPSKDGNQDVADVLQRIEQQNDEMITLLREIKQQLEQ